MISFGQVNLQYGERKLFDNISFQVNARDRIGLVGKNGAGKSTLLKVIVGLVRCESGEITVPGDINVAYLPQELVCMDTRNVLDETLTAFSDMQHLEREISHLNEEMASRTDYESDQYMELAVMIAEKNERLQMINSASAEATAIKTLLGLGFRESDLKRPTKEFSGGWRMRIELAKILLQSPDIFLLDEPTNHLDIESIQWLENFLSQYHGAVILISHDRAFLDKVTNRTLEITLGKIHDYAVSYSRYVVLRDERREQQLAAYRNQQKQIEDTKEFIERFRYKATKAVQVQSRIRQLEKMEVIEIEEEDKASLNIKFPPAPRSGTIAVKLRELSKRYGAHLVLDRLELNVERGEKVAFVGRNGEGKTTLSRIIVGELDHEGECSLGHNVNLGYYAQNQDELLSQDMTVFQTIDRVAVGDIRTKIRDILGAFLFSGEDVDKKVKVLSGGEKSRLALARLLLEPYNLLVLDEPTNHLDMRSKDLLKQALKKYDGTLIVVSHDREFLDGLTDKIYEFRDHRIKEFRGGIYDFLEKRKLQNLEQLNAGLGSPVRNLAEKAPSQQKISYQERKEFDREIRKTSNQVEKLEAEMDEVEKSIKSMDAQLAEGAQGIDPEFFGRYEELKKRQDSIMMQWERLQYELDILNDKRNSVI
ncbi:MAG: ABC-F family ATP-binding cassette domain-containing protein [Bacteroidales bacterium]|nr:ABC-F family ATP-binding cassette domain-containing protein [Bacteroidales bacterium]